KGLPSSFAAPIFVALHIDPRRLARLPSILTKAGRLPVELATDGEQIREGKVYLAPCDSQMVFSDKTIFLSDAPQKHGLRPTIDTLFGCAAAVFEERTVGVILSGASEDGGAGLAAVRRNGGITMVQSPSDAAFPLMPSHALETSQPDYTLPARAIGPALALLVHDSQLLRRIA